MTLLTFENVRITDTWEGFFLNHLVPEEHPNYDKPHNLPNNVDWKRDLAPGISLIDDAPIMVNFLWALKVYRLYVNPESQDRDRLDRPEAITAIGYDYGEITDGLPQRQDRIFYGLYKATPESEVELREYKRQENPFNDSGQRYDASKGRRQTAVDYTKQRAIEIDRTVEGIYAAYGEDTATAMGLKRYDLSAKILDFFEQFDFRMNLYIKTGNLKINSSIQTLLDSALEHWLKEDIPITRDKDGIVFVQTGWKIQDIFAEALRPVTQLQVNAKIALFTIEEKLSNLAIKLGLGDRFDRFRSFYLGENLNLEAIKAIVPLPPNDPNEENWLFTPVPDSETTLANLTEEQKTAIALHPEAETLNFRQQILLTVSG